LSRLICRIANALPVNSPLAGWFDRHRGGCLRCQADAARLRGVARDLGGLEGEMLSAPGGLHTSVMSTLPRQDAANPRRPLLLRVVARWATGVGVAVATLAAIIGRKRKG